MATGKPMSEDCFIGILLAIVVALILTIKSCLTKDVPYTEDYDDSEAEALPYSAP
jgi:hypothetical protein